MPSEKETLAHEIALLFRNELLYSGGASLVVMGFMIYSGPILTYVFHQDKIVATLAQDFLKINALMIPAILFELSCEQLLYSNGYTKLAMLIGLGSLSIGMSIATTLGFGWFGFPRLGVQGILIGYGVEAYITAFIYGLYTLYHRDFQNLQLRNYLFSSLKGNAKKFITMITSGSVITASLGSEMLVNYLVANFMGQISVSAQEALAMTSLFSSINRMLAVSFGLASSLSLGRAIGAQSHHEIYRIGAYGCITSLQCTVLPILFACYPKLLMIIFNNQDETVYQHLKVLAPIISAINIGNLLRIMLLLQLRQLNDIYGSTIACVTGLLLGLPMSAYLGFKTDLQATGIMLGSLFGMFMAVGLLFIQWKQAMQPHRETVEATNSPLTKFSLFNQNNIKPTAQLTEDPRLQDESELIPTRTCGR